MNVKNRMFEKRLFNILVIIFISMSIIFVGCKKKIERTIKDKKTGEVAKVKIEEGKAEITIKGKDKRGEGRFNMDQSKSEMTFTQQDESGKVTEKVIVGAKIPEDFRKDIPIYKNSKATMSSSNKDTQTLMLTTEDAYEKVSNFYKEDLKKNDWEIKDTQTISTGQMDMTNFECEKEGVKLIAHIMTVDQDGKKVTQIALNVTKNE